MKTQVWSPEPLPRKKPSKRKPRQEKEEEPDTSELLGSIQDIGDSGVPWDVKISQSTYRTGGGG